VHGGEAVRIMTGAPTPANCTVVPIERCEVSGTSVTIADAADRKPGRNVAWRGEDAAKGAVVVAAGSRLSPAVLGAVAMAGAERVSVYAAPRIAIRTTGDEVGGSGEAGIADSNGPLLTALCQSLGLPSDRAHAKDTMNGLEAALAPGGADCVITTGGVSMGDRDLVPAAAAAAGFETIFHRVAIQPGKPVLLARHGDGRLLLGLPGNPVSVLATAHLFLLPLLERCWPGFDSGWRTISTAETIANPKRRRLFRPAALGPTGVGLVPWNGSGDLLAASHGDGVVDLVPGASVDAGGQVRFLPWVGQRLGAGSLLPPRR
jgi:molybdopterin molybdotransferase